MLTIEIEEIAVGPVIRRLTNMPGIVALHMDLDKLSAKPGGQVGVKRGPYKKNGADSSRSSLRGEVLRMMSDGKPIERKAIHNAFNPTAAEPRRTSLRNVIYNAERDGYLKKAGAGKVALAEKGRAALKAKVA